MAKGNWLNNKMDFLLTPAQKTPGKEKGSKKEFTQYAAQFLQEMKPAERKKYAEIYARLRRLHNTPEPKKAQK